MIRQFLLMLAIRLATGAASLGVVACGRRAALLHAVGDSQMGKRPHDQPGCQSFWGGRRCMFTLNAGGFHPLLYIHRHVCERAAGIPNVGTTAKRSLSGLI